MGKGLEPMIGQLRILRNLMRIIDPAYARVLESNAPLPYFSLSHLLTLFSHEVSTLRQIQHIFDFLICRDPSAAIYLAAQVLLEKRSQILEAVENDDDGMLHTVLSGWPLNDSSSDIEDPLVLSRKFSSRSSDELDAVLGSTWEDGREQDLRTDRRRDAALDALPRPSPSVEEKLSELLKRTDQLRSLYPRTLPELGMPSVFGPNSVFFTWSQHNSSLHTDQEAEKMILDQELIVYPYNPTPPGTDDEDRALKRPGARRKLQRKVTQPIHLLGPRAVVASALLVLGIAIVMYNGQQKNLARLSPSLLWAKFVGDRYLPWLRRLYR